MARDEATVTCDEARPVEVTIPPVRCFAHVEPDRAQALIKVLDEADEVVEAWKDYEKTLGIDDYIDKLRRGRLLDECADVIQATLNLVAALGVEDFRPYLKACELRNRERGRITDGKVVDKWAMN